MSDLAIMEICLTAIIIAAIISGTWYSLHKVDPVEESRQRMLAAEDRFIEAMNKPRGKDLWLPPSATKVEHSQPPEPKPDPMTPWLEDEPPYEPESMAPIPVDHDNPPKPLVYSRKPGSTAPTPRCTCHGRLLKEGQEILWWPVPDSTVVKVYCQRENS